MKKRTVALLLCLLLVAAGGLGGWLYYRNTYLVIGEETYRRDIAEMDFSGGALPDAEVLAQLPGLKKLNLLNTGLTAEDYERYRAALPGCEILWELPFQGGYLPLDTKELTLTRITEEDMAQLSYLTELRSVDATAVTDLEAVMLLKERFPELEVSYQVAVNGQTLSPAATELTADNADTDELMTQLKYLPDVKDVTFTGTVPDKDSIASLRQAYPEVSFHWSFTFFGLEVTSDTTEIDLSGIRMDSVEELEAGLAQFNHLEKVIMCDTGLPSEEIDDLWKRHPETRFVWNVKVGRVWIRTDATYFMPFQYGYDGTKGIRLYDRDCTEMKYLVDLICIDFGHMGISDCSFLAYMPHMQYLILSDTPVSDISALANLKELKYLEAFKCNIRDISPLLGCTALEDVNLCNNWIEDVSLLGQIESLNNIWISGVNWPQEQKDALNAAKPDATIVYWQNWGSTGRGWRYLDNYYNHRDVMGMFYLDDDGNAYWTRKTGQQIG